MGGGGGRGGGGSGCNCKTGLQETPSLFGDRAVARISLASCGSFV